MEGGFQEPLVVDDAVALQIRLHLADIVGDAELLHLLPALLRVSVQPGIPVLLPEKPGQLPDVLPVVAVLRELHRVLALDELDVPGLQAPGEQGHLVARVVHVKLPPDLPARPLQDGGHGVPQDAAPGVAHGHGARGVGGDEFHHDPAAFALVHLAVGRTLAADILQHAGIPGAPQAEVQEAGSGDLHGVEPAVRQVQLRRQGLRQLPGGHAQGLGAAHGIGTGIVAVLRILGDLDLSVQFACGGEGALFRRGGTGLLQQGVDLLPGRFDHTAHGFFSPLSDSAGTSFTSIWNTLRPSGISFMSTV